MGHTLGVLLINLLMTIATSAQAYEYHCRPMPVREDIARLAKEEIFASEARGVLLAWTGSTRADLMEEYQALIADPTVPADEKIAYRAKVKELKKSLSPLELRKEINVVKRLEMELILKKAESGYLDPRLCPASTRRQWSDSF